MTERRLRAVVFDDSELYLSRGMEGVRRANWQGMSFSEVKDAGDELLDAQALVTGLGSASSPSAAARHDFPAIPLIDTAVALGRPIALIGSQPEFKTFLPEDGRSVLIPRYKADIPKEVCSWLLNLTQ